MSSPISKNKMRSAARLSAVQSMYGAKLTGEKIIDTVARFIENGSVADLGDITIPADEALYSRIVHGCIERGEEIATIANSALKKRPIEKQASILQYILTAGIFELLDNAEADSKLIVSEYVDIAHAFYEPQQAGLVNGVLDNIAKVVRT